MSEEETRRPWGILNSLTEGIHSIPLVDNEINIGKATLNPDSKNISRIHFKIMKKGEGVFYIRDCSTNGTFVNNNRIKRNEIIKIKDGVDIIVLNPLHPDSIRFMFMSYESNEIENPEFIEFCDKYEYGKYIGEGGYATVRIVTEKATGEQYAMKIINRIGKKTSSKRIDAQYDEIKVLSRLSHPNIVNTKDIFTTDYKTYIVMDL